MPPGGRRASESDIVVRRNDDPDDDDGDNDDGKLMADEDYTAARDMRAKNRRWEQSRTTLVRSSEGVCICCGLPFSDLKNFGQQNVRNVLRELEVQFRGKLRYCYKQFPGYMQRSHIIHLHMERFILKHNLKEVETSMAAMDLVARQEVTDLLDNIDLESFSGSYVKYMAYIHKAVAEPFKKTDKEIQRNTERDDQDEEFAWLGYNEMLRAQTNMVTICDENCNRGQTSYSHFYHNAIPDFVMQKLTEKIEERFQNELGVNLEFKPRTRNTTLVSVVNTNLNFVLVHALQYSALCRHLVKATDGRTKTFDREAGFFIQLANNRNIHLSFVLYELAINLMYDKKIIENNASIFQRWWKWVVQEYCHLMGEQLSDIVFRDASMQFREGVFPMSEDAVDESCDAERVLAYVSEFLKHIANFVDTNEFQVLLYKLLTIADLDNISREDLKSGCNAFFVMVKDTPSETKTKMLYAYLISDEAIWKRVKRDSTMVSAVNYDDMAMYILKSQENNRFFRLFATTMQLCAPPEVFKESKSICQKYISRDAINSTFDVDDTRWYRSL